MDEDKHLALVRRFYAAVNAGATEALSELLAADFVSYGPDGPSPGVAALQAFVAAVRRRVPDLTVTPDALLTAADQVGAALTLRGTSSDGRPLVAAGIHLYRVTGGRIAERWYVTERRPFQPEAPATAEVPGATLVRRYLEDVVGRRELDAADALFAPDFRIAPHVAAPGPAGVRAFVRGLLAAFPDLAVRVERLLAEGELVAADLTVRGTHRGPWRGLAPTGRRISFRELQVYRVAEGRLAARRYVPDLGSALRQLGADPRSSRGPASER